MRSPSISRRTALRDLAASFATLATPAWAGSGCRRADVDGRNKASLWFSYGGKNREVLLELVDRFHLEEPRYRIEPTFQGDYFEALAKLRTAIAAKAAPTVTHVVGEIVPHAEWYDYAAKYDEGGSDIIVPARIPDDVARRVQELAVDSFVATECEGMARVDFFVRPDGQPVVAMRPLP